MTMNKVSIDWITKSQVNKKASLEVQKWKTNRAQGKGWLSRAAPRSDALAYVLHMIVIWSAAYSKIYDTELY